MANHTNVTAAHPAMDYAEHERTYALFVNLCKLATGVSISVLVLMAIFLL